MTNSHPMISQNNSECLPAQPNFLPTQPNPYEAIIHLVTDGMTSEHSRRAYARALRDFLDWWDDEGRPALSKALVQRYRLKLQDDGLIRKHDQPAHECDSEAGRRSRG